MSVYTPSRDRAELHQGCMNLVVATQATITELLGEKYRTGYAARLGGDTIVAWHRPEPAPGDYLIWSVWANTRDARVRFLMNLWSAQRASLASGESQ